MQRVLLASTAVWLAAVVAVGIPAAPASAAVRASGPRAVSDPVSRLADGPQTSPVVAFGGGRYLAVWTDGRADEATHADLMRHTRDGWPKCCGQTMAYFAEAERPRMSDPTPPEGPALPPAP